MTVEQVIDELMDRYPMLIRERERIEECYSVLHQCFSKGKKLLLCGNGGSAADSLHIAGELMKSFTSIRKIDGEIEKKLCSMYSESGKYLANKLEGALPAIPLTGNTAFATAYANDVEPDIVYAQQVYALGNIEDVLLCLSTSGNAKNVLYAAMVARASGLRVIGLTGNSGGKLSEYCDTCIKVPETETYKVQELHLPVYHAICRMLEVKLWEAY